MQAEKGDLNSMQITDVRVRKVTKEGKLKAVVSITIDNEFVVHDIKVIEGEKLVYRNAEQKSSGWGISRYRTSDQFRYKRKDSEYDIGSVSGISGSRYGRIWGKCKKRKIRAAACLMDKR